MDDNASTGGDSNDENQIEEKTRQKKKTIVRRKKRRTGISGKVRRSSRFPTSSPSLSITKSRITIDLTRMDPDHGLERIEMEKSTITSSSKDEAEKQEEVEELEDVRTCLRVLKGSREKPSTAVFLKKLFKLINSVGMECDGLEDTVKELLLKVGNNSVSICSLSDQLQEKSSNLIVEVDSEEGGGADEVLDGNGSEIDDTIVVDSHFQSTNSPRNDVVEDDIENAGSHDEDMEGDNNEDSTGEV